MSTGENINANGAGLNQSMIRVGFTQFPQTQSVQLNPAQWNQIAPILIAEGYPFKAFESADVPAGQMWFRGATGELLGRIINIGNAPK
jgi:hypothetical protein